MSVFGNLLGRPGDPLVCRSTLGWDSWGYGYETGVAS